MSGTWTRIESLREFESWAKAFAIEIEKRLRACGAVEIALCGELGAGKTTLVRMCAAHLGIREPVSSPSYVLQHEYRRQAGGNLEHWDLYRVPELPMELLEPVRHGGLRMIEWADKVEELVSRADVVVRLRRACHPSGEEAREICVTYRH